MNVVKDTETAVNLYEQGQLDKVDLTGDYVDAYQSHDEYHTELTGSTSYLKMNQGKDGEQTDLANLHIRKALNMALDKEQMVDTILNNGSIVAQGNVPKGLAENPETGEDFRAENGDLTHEDPEAARDHWEKGLAELGKDALTFAVTTTDSDSSKRFAENFKHQLEEKLPGLTLDIKVVTPKASVAANVGQDYELIFTGWNGDYQDPLTYLNLFITDSPGNHTGYTDPAYDKLVLGAKSDLADKPEERWEALLKAEKMLIEDSAVLIPLYQKGTAYMQKANVKNLTTYQVSADNYKWAEIE
jgi:ABC-type oligopeptide transport system substrate-binding subunit